MRKRPAAAPTPADTASAEPRQAAPAPRVSDRQRLQMADIARLAGVSIATVSRALNGSTLVNEATRERVSELAQSLNYSINLSAKNLRLGRNRTVAVVIPYDTRSRQHISDPFFLTMMGSLADRLTEHGFDMLLSRVDADRLEAASQSYDSGVAVGIVLIGQWRHHDQLNRIAQRGVPLVVWGAQMPQQQYCCIGGDNVAGGMLATRHLLQQGCRRIVFLGDPQLPEVAQRHVGYTQELAAQGLQADPRLLLDVPFETGLAREAVAGLVERGERFDAVFACSDVLAMAAVQALRTAGLQVPRSVAVVGYDDIEWASHSDPPLTTVRQPIAAAGDQIVAALLALLAGQHVPSSSLQVELIVRQSSLRHDVAPVRRAR